MKTGVLVHSKYLQMAEWEKTIWGEPPGLMGQFPKAILVALEEDAEIMVLGCGLCSGIHGEMESEYNWWYILDNFQKLSKFAEFATIDLGRAKRQIADILVLDRQSLDTTQEIKFSGILFETKRIEKVIGVTAPTHAPRCLNEALKFYGRPESKIALKNVSVQNSDVGWVPNDDVVVFEPTQRTDDLMRDIRQQAAKMLLVPDKFLKIKKALGL